MNKIPNITTLQYEKKERSSHINNMYKIVLNKCVEKIIYTNKHTDKSFTIFEVPKMLIGQPSYNVQNCIHYIISELHKNGYLISYSDPGFIYIDWGTNKIIQSTNKKLKEYFPNLKNVEYIIK